MKNRKSRLLIDDTRDETNVKWGELDIIARNYWTGIECLKLRKWDVLILDHDLNSFDASGKEWTGYDIIKWLRANPEHLPAMTVCCSSNPAGRKNIEDTIKELYSEN